MTADPNEVPITQVMTRTPVTARATSSVPALVALMTEHHIGCIPIVDELDRPTGIVTKLDLVECRDDERQTAREVMMPHAMFLLEDATVARAAALMTTEGFHHLLVVDARRALVGVVSTFDITRWVATA
jgi:CBS-domain-containing membrane protein